MERYRQVVIKLRREEVEVAAIHQRLKERGYTGSYSSVYRFVRNLEPAYAGCDGASGDTASATVRDFHWRLGRILWDDVGMSRTEESLKRGIEQIRALRAEFWESVNVVGTNDFNKELEFAGRVADFLELGELMAIDALERRESCGGHFRDEYQYPDGEAMRDDENFAYAAAWKYNGEGAAETVVREALQFENVKPTKRSYK